MQCKNLANICRSSGQPQHPLPLERGTDGVYGVGQEEGHPGRQLWPRENIDPQVQGPPAGSQPQGDEY